MRVVEKIEEFESPRRLRPGTLVHLAMRPEEPPSRITLRLDRDRTLYLYPDGEEGAWDGRLDSVQVVRDTILIAGLVNSNLYEAGLTGDVDRLAPGERYDVARRLELIFAWQIDFWRDIQPGDGYRVAIAREVRPDGTIRSARVLAAEFRNRDRDLTAARFRPDSMAPVEYYDFEGEAVRGQFLLAPIDLARVTSGFGRRYHPILKRRRPHLGLDYGAPTGTPVRATGGGIVTRAGRWGTYGNIVEVRHANNLRTRYAHLSRISGGVTVGVRVDQGQVIGRVGSTGLSTASHLHYEFLKNGTHVNPARLNLPRAEPVPPEHRELFNAARDAAFAVLEGIRMPAETDPSRVGFSRLED
jgi:murein DD-endopeptidase MepM/ murein hydrolase activator NlpD